MILAEAILLGLVVGLVSGGRLRNLQLENMRGEWLLMLLLPLQLVWPNVAMRLGLGQGVSVVAWLLMMMALAAVLLLNSSRAWMLAFAGLGIALNILVIGLNGAMPVSTIAVAHAGMDSAAAQQALEAALLHEALGERTVAPWLADVIPVPGPQWQRGVVSVGDILLALGLALWVFCVCRFGRIPRGTTSHID